MYLQWPPPTAGPDLAHARHAFARRAWQKAMKNVPVRQQQRRPRAMCGFARNATPGINKTSVGSRLTTWRQSKSQIPRASLASEGVKIIVVPWHVCRRLSARQVATPTTVKFVARPLDFLFVANFLGLEANRRWCPNRSSFQGFCARNPCELKQNAIGDSIDIDVILFPLLRTCTKFVSLVAFERGFVFLRRQWYCNILSCPFLRRETMATYYYVMQVGH